VEGTDGAFAAGNTWVASSALLPFSASSSKMDRPGRSLIAGISFARRL